MDVITTHINADFDCIGSMLAARQLYPGAVMIFSGSQEREVHNFLQKHHFSFSRLKDIDSKKISRLIIVDCQHASRVGPFADIIEKQRPEIHIFDHHPETFGSLQPVCGVIRPCGSTSTLLANMLMAKGALIPREEATAMLLGIYEDTGNLTYSSTGVEDYNAAAWLLGQGAELGAVHEHLGKGLSAIQISLLNELLHSLKSLPVAGGRVCMSTASIEFYVGDIAVLAHTIMDMEGIDTFFMVVGMGSRVYLVARSRDVRFNAGEILSFFGGGGHHAAASASVKDLTVIQVAARLEELVFARANARRSVGSIMTSPVKSVISGSTLSEARGCLTRYNVNAMPVLKGDRMIGVISRRIVEKALYHSLGGEPVDDYMHTDFIRLSPESSIHDLKEYLTGENHRFAPVFNGDELVGVVTRTDLFSYINSQEKGVELQRSGEAGDANIILKTRHMLSPRLYEILHSLGKAADLIDLKIYAVGGFVRDLLLGRQNFDVDITVEGDGIFFAETFAADNGCRVKSHQKFGTATIIFSDGVRIDVASTRLEYYDSPGGLPTVERSSLKMDLYRRDFTINTLALSLSAADFGRLIDFYGARNDLKEKSIRVLHNLSFVEDPTRIFRGVRFEQRLGFRMATHTENLIKNSIRLNFIDRLGGRRIFNELVHLFEEENPESYLARIATLGALRFLHRSLTMTDRITSVFRESGQMISWFELLYLNRPYEKWGVYLFALCTELTHDDFVELCIRLDIGNRYINSYTKARQAGEQALLRIESSVHGRGVAMRPSEVYALLDGMPVEILLHLMARCSEDARRQLSIYITHLSLIEAEVNGSHLKELGLKPGPVYKTILDELLSARLDGRAGNFDEEMELAREIIKNGGKQ